MAQQKKPSAQDQQKYNLLVTQAVKFLTEQKNVSALYSAIKVEGAEQAIANAIKQVMASIGTAAAMGKARIEPHTVAAAVKEIATMLIIMAAGAKLIDNPKQTIATVMELVMGRGGPQQPQRPPGMDSQPQGMLAQGV